MREAIEISWVLMPVKECSKNVRNLNLVFILSSENFSLVNQIVFHKNSKIDLML